MIDDLKTGAAAPRVFRACGSQKLTAESPDAAAQLVVRELTNKSKGLACRDAKRQLDDIRDWAANAQSSDSRTFCASYVFDKGITRGKEWTVEVDIRCD